MSDQLPVPSTVRILDVDLHNLSRAELFARLDRGALFNPNVDVLMKLHKDPSFLEIFNRAEFRICDSQIVLMASRFLGTPIKEKISGSDFFGEFCAYHRADPDIRVFLLGAKEGVAAEAARRVNARIGREIVVASLSPSFGFERDPVECAQIVDTINASGATVLAVGVGAPKQERWIIQYRDQMPQVRIFLAVGATIDFEAGNVQRAPAWMSRSGLEWAFRLAVEPRRLWRRYLVDDLPFLWLVLKQRLRVWRRRAA